MTTLGDLKSRIATDLTRSDLTSQIASAVSDAIAHYEASRFWFNQSRSLTFSTVAGQMDYTVSDLADISTLIGINAMFCIDGTQTIPMDWYEPGDFELLTTTTQGRPDLFTYTDSSIRLWPKPIKAYTMRLHCHYRLSDLSGDSDSNAWTTYAEQLIRCHAKLLLYANVLEDDQGAARMQGQVQAHKDKLDYETSRRLASGHINAAEF